MSAFNGKAGYVTGAASGIGRASAIAFAAEGASVVVSDLETKRREGEAVVRLIEKSGGKATFVPTDVRKEEDVKNLVSATVSFYGGLNFAVNNAGVDKGGRMTDLEVSDFDDVIATNLRGVWLGTKYALAYMQEHGGGAIVNTASEAGLVGPPGASAYSASKHGVIGLTKAAAGEYAGLNIRVNAVAPGATATPMVTEQSRENQDALIDPQPMHRMAAPAEIAEAILWLASEKASFVTGTVLAVDGGATSNAQSYNKAQTPSLSDLKTSEQHKSASHSIGKIAS